MQFMFQFLLILIKMAVYVKDLLISTYHLYVAKFRDPYQLEIVEPKSRIRDANSYNYPIVRITLWK